MTKIHRFTIGLDKNVKITYPIKEEMNIDEWIKMINYINSILKGADNERI